MCGYQCLYFGSKFLVRANSLTIFTIRKIYIRLFLHSFAIVFFFISFYSLAVSEIYGMADVFCCACSCSRLHECNAQTQETHLKKSSLQYNFASLLKHFSDKGFWHSQHTTHDVCHRRSDTFNKNLSKIGSLQPAQGSPTPIDGSARPGKEWENR